MAIDYEFQTHVTCDKCGQWVAYMNYRYAVIEQLRSEGWKIGKYVTCPKCVIAQKAKED